MADISSNIDKMNDIEISSEAPLTEALFNKMSANINGLIDSGLSAVFETTTSTTFDIPEDIAKIILESIAPGGSGSGGRVTGGAAGGGGGGSSSQLIRSLDVTAAETLTITIPAAPAGGSENGGAGIDGGDVTIAGTFGTITIKGGVGAGAATGGIGGLGGGSTKDPDHSPIASFGGDGGDTGVAGGEGQRSASFVGGTGGAIGGAAGGGGGAASVYGAGPTGADGDTVAPGNDGPAPGATDFGVGGSGGGGGLVSFASGSGGAAGGGLVRIWF